MARLAHLVGLLLLAAGPGLAQDISAADKARLLKDRVGFLEAAAMATHWFGDRRGLNAQAVEDFVAAQRAARRADVMGLVLQADLSGDGIVTRDEVLRLAPGLPPGLRGRLIAGTDLADSDRDGAVSAEEIRRYAQGEAVRLFPDRKARDLRLILLFDGNGDGWVSYDEVVQKLKDLAA